MVPRGLQNAPVAGHASAAVQFDVDHVTSAIGRGDTQAFELLYRAWFVRVYRMARGATRRDESFCLDVQEVMLRVAKRLPRIRTERELAAWMGRAMVSSAIDLMRKDSRARRRERQVAKAENQTVSEKWSTQEELEWLAQALDRLPTAEQALLVQRIANGSSLRATGLAVGVSDQAAHGRIRRAVRKLREQAREVWHDA